MIRSLVKILANWFLALVFTLIMLFVYLVWELPKSREHFYEDLSGLWEVASGRWL